MSNFPILLPDLQVGFHYRLQIIKDLYFHEALRKTLRGVQISDVDEELKKYVSDQSLNKLALSSLRAEAIFPIPLLLKINPYLVGYYRLLFGFSQKEFYGKGPFGIFKSMEERGAVSKKSLLNLDEFCFSLIATGQMIVDQIDNLNIGIIQELQLLTVGPQFRGSMNNTYGQAATQRTFSIIKDLVEDYIESSTPVSIRIKNDSGRLVDIAFAPDPDIEIIEHLSSGASRGLISIEIKGGRDHSNIHNRIGEAEKSHQKAKLRGYREFMTIISVDIEYSTLRKESPTTSHFFHIDKIGESESKEFLEFMELLSSILGIKIN